MMTKVHFRVLKILHNYGPFVPLPMLNQWRTEVRNCHLPDFKWN